MSLTFTEAVLQMSPAARRALDAVAAKVPRVPIPAIQLPNEDDPATFIRWSYANTYVEIEISDAGYEWFARERVTGAFDGSEEGSDISSPDPVPEACLLWLKRISERPSHG